MPSRDKLAVLTDGTNTYKLALAEPFDPERPAFRIGYRTTLGTPVEWKIDNFSGGQGNLGTWDPERPSVYWWSSRARPAILDHGWIQGVEDSTTTDDAPATFTEGRVLAVAQGKLWACRDTTLHEWQPATDDWEATGIQSGTGSAVTSIAEGGDGWIYTGHVNDKIFRTKYGTTVYFDGSDVAASDPGAVWTNETNADDGSTSTSATTTTAGSVSSNYLMIEGTDAAASGDTISSVVLRVHYGAASASGVQVRTDAWSENLLDTTHAPTAAGWKGFYTEALTAPSGGWTWAKIQALEVRIWATSTTGVNVTRLELQVNTTSGGGLGEEWLSSGFSYDPVVVSAHGRLFALDGDDLWKLDTLLDSGAALTDDDNQQVADLTGDSDVWLTSGNPGVYRRACTTDTGVAWLQRLDSGRCVVHHYNVFEDTAEPVAMLPELQVMPYDIYFAYGFIFVVFRHAEDHDQPGPAALYYKALRSSQQGTIDLPLPERTTSDIKDIVGFSATTASMSAVIPGVFQGQLLIYYDKQLFGYAVGRGALYALGESSAGQTDEATGAVFDHSAFVGGNETNKQIERFDFSALTTTDGNLYTGFWDFGMPGTKKILLDVSVVANSLNVSRTVDTSYAVDSGLANLTYTSTPGSAASSGAFNTWTVAAEGAAVTGHRFAFKITTATNINSLTPVVQAMIARAAPYERRKVFELLVRLYVDGDVEGHTSEPQDTIDDLVAAVEAESIWTFTQRWTEGDDDPGTGEAVWISGAQLVDIESGVARLELTSVTTV